MSEDLTISVILQVKLKSQNVIFFLIRQMPQLKIQLKAPVKVFLFLYLKSKRCLCYHWNYDCVQIKPPSQKLHPNE